MGKFKDTLRWLLVTVICCFVFGCTDGTFDTTKCLLKAKEKYSTAVAIPGKHYVYIAVDDENNVHYIEVKGDIEKGITYDAVIIKAQNCK